jgi:hypothetical protein
MKKFALLTYGKLDSTGRNAKGHSAGTQDAPKW